MPRWKALPDELDPEVREFADRLRGLVAHSGLSVAAVADRTGYSKTSWERYLNGRLLAPKGAVVALAEVTGTQPVHLLTLWELAERAWSRSEMRHDMTMQAIRISQARAALGELGEREAAGPPPATVSPAPVDSPSAADARTKGAASRGDAGTARGGSRGAGGVTGVAGPAGVSPTVPRPTWPSPSYVPSPSYGAASVPPYGAAPVPVAAPDGGTSPDRRRRRRKLVMFLAGVLGALVVMAAAAFLTDVGFDFGGKGGTTGEHKPSAAPSTGDGKLPAGVECRGGDCAGKDPEAMGCGGERARTASRATVGGTLIEVRYSKTCRAAWARITRATPGDEVTVKGLGGGAAAGRTGTVDEDFDAYTPMVAARTQGAAKACAVLVSGQRGCTE